MASAALVQGQRQTGAAVPVKRDESTPADRARILKAILSQVDASKGDQLTDLRAEAIRVDGLAALVFKDGEGPSHFTDALVVIRGLDRHLPMTRARDVLLTGVGVPATLLSQVLKSVALHSDHDGLKGLLAAIRAVKTGSVVKPTVARRDTDTWRPGDGEHHLLRFHPRRHSAVASAYTKAAPGGESGRKTGTA